MVGELVLVVDPLIRAEETAEQQNRRSSDEEQQKTSLNCVLLRFDWDAVHFPLLHSRKQPNEPSASGCRKKRQ